MGEKQQGQEAKSQQKEQMVLLEKKSATYSQVCQGNGHLQGSQGFLVCLLFYCLLFMPFSSCLLGAQVLLRCLSLLQRLLQEHRLKSQSELDRINAQYLEIKCSAMILKLR